MNKRTFPEWLFTLVFLAVAFAIALYIRVALPYQTVFDGQWIKLTGIDAYYYMRLVDNLVPNFPQIMAFDPYLLFPGGDFVTRVPTFFAYILAGPIKLLGGSAPTQQTIDTIAVYIPAVMGAFTIIPAFFIGRALANRWAGSIAAILLATMPGELLSRSLLGNTDHHVAEIFFTSFFAMFFILAIKHGRNFTYEMLLKGQFSPSSRHIIYSLIAGIFLGFYLITWQGALLFFLIIFIYFIIQFISDHLRGFPTDYLSKIAITCFLVALLIFVPVSRDKLTLLGLAVILLTPIALNIISSIMAARSIKPIYFLAAIGGLAGIGGLTAWLLFQPILQTAVNYMVGIFSWNMGQNVVGEMKPLLLPVGSFTLDMAWIEYALVFYSGLAGLALLIYNTIRRGEPEHIFTAIWSIVMMLVSLAMIRFASYFAVCLVVLTGYIAGRIIEMASPHKAQETQDKPHKKAKKSAARPKRRTAGQTAAVLVVAAAVIMILIPGTATAISEAKNPVHSPTNAWMESLDWLRQNSPEPLGNPDFYYTLYRSPEPGKSYEYPRTAYSVLVWSDYGYWVTRIAHRMPQSNPATVGAKGEALYFTAQDPASTVQIMKNMGARYVIIDNRIASPNDKFYALASLSNKKESDFYELCWQKKDGKYVPLLIFYPEYYRSMVIRLYNFDCLKIVPQNTTAMAYQEQQMPDGQKFKEITGFRNFKTYAEAEAFVRDQRSNQYRIIGTDPLSSPVPLEPLTNYKLIYQSTQKASTGSAPLSAIKIFEYNAPVN